VVTLISFDIDGTLEIGDPPGIITIEMVRQARAHGWVIGSCSDRTLGMQTNLWAKQQIDPDFMVLKHRLADIKAQFQANVYYHIGDTHMDQYYAEQAGFRFVWAEREALRQIGPDIFWSALDLLGHL
jgi:hypothetical protein